MERMVFTPELGAVTIVDEPSGAVMVSCVAGFGDSTQVSGPYYDVLTVFDAAEELRRKHGAAHGWRIYAADPTDRSVPVYDSDRYDAALVGEAVGRQEAEALLGATAAYRPDGAGPNGDEAWVPA